MLSCDTIGQALVSRLAPPHPVKAGLSKTRVPDPDGHEAIITADGGVPESFLYETASLDQPAAAARRLIGGLGSRPLLRINPGISTLVLTAASRLAQLVQGFDFYGLLLSPIHTFEYLQSVAQAMAREAVQAEREFINFKSREELEAATRRDLERAVAMAEAEVEGRRQLYEAARDDRQAAERAMELATRRRNDAIDQRNHYASSSLQQIWAQAAATAQGGGSDSWYSEISELADKLDRGESISGERGKLAAAYALHGGRKNREYELARMQDTIDQLTAAIEVAREQRDSAAHRENAAEIAWRAAQEQRDMAAASLEAFDAELFTPDAWATMASVMRSISASHLERAIRIAKLMERAYNFENDTTLHVIKSEYGFGLTGDDAGSDTRLLGGDALLVDVEAFTYHAITSTTRKTSRIKDVISVANDFPAQFDELRRTGLLSIETDLYEFDRLHPGFYEQRIEAVEVELIGLVSPEGLNGTLTAGGVTKFRRRDGSTASRTHVVDTMALSDFELRNDVFLYTADTGVRGQFQGIGVGSTWQLHLPRRSNDFEFARIFDVRLILYYKAKYDAALRASVLEQPVRPGELSRLRNLRLRYDFPAAWYAFYKSGATTFELDCERFGAHERAFRTNAVLARVVTEEGVSNEGIELRIAGPGGVEGTATTGPEGAVSTEMAGLSDLVAIDPLGEWTVEVLGGPSITEDGELRYGRVRDVQLGLDYRFEYEEEVI